MRIILLILALWLPTIASAQNAATLVADRVALNGQDQLIASGNVEVLFEGSRMTASEIIFDQPSDTLRIIGPIFIQTSEGALLTATSATLDPRLENGILQGARIVLDQQLQLAANQIDRREGRFSQLYKTSATSCRVCGPRPPLWEIRAERVVHDTQEQQIYFRNATFHIRGVPFFWLPRMRLPDPSLERSTGILVPEQRNTTQLGFGIKLPYFITLGDHRDLTVTPYISSETRTLELRYRQAFTNGRITAEGAVSDDTLASDTRSYFFAEGRFDLSNDYQLIFDVETVSDRAYLLDYGYSEKDRLDSALELLRVTDTALFDARLIYYRTLRDDEENASLPPLISDMTYEDSFAPAFGGLLRYGASLDLAIRESETDGDEGRDVARAGLEGTWSDSWVLRNGFVADAQMGLRTDLYFITDDIAFSDEDLRVAPQVGLTLRWPLARVGGNGSTHLLEPVVSLSWSDSFGGTPPNEDSLRTELDRANLTAAARFAGEDRVETGVNAAAGLTWTRFGAGGLTSTVSFGRVVRQEAQDGFTQTSGLDERTSDWLVAAQVTAPGGFLVDARSLWDNDGLTVADSRVTWRNDWVSLGANYIWLGPDAGEDRDETISEWTVDAALALSDAWTFEIDGRYDVAADRAVRGGLGLQWQNECVTVDVSVSRRFTSSTTVDPTTTFGISGSIGSFATGSAASECGN